jgi:23S rRNA (guanosine2251-2'-O)-methyltransferase
LAARQGGRKAGGRRGGSADRHEHLDGVHVVLEALRARRRKLVRLRVASGRGARGPDLPAVLEAARAAGVPVEEVPPGEIRARDDRGNPQRMALEAGPLPEVGLDALLAAAPGPDRRLLLLDGVEDPQNLGAIARVAEAAGAIGIVTAERRSAPLSPAATRASAGALEWLPVVRVGNLSRAMEELKRRGFWLLGADPGAPESIFEMAPRLLAGDLAVALGAEGRGLRPGVLAQMDHRVRIPMAGRVGSLNVATAGAVLLFELLRRTGAPEPPSG